MFRRLKVPVHDIAIRPPGVLKGSLDHNLYILLRTVGLYYLLVLFLCRRTKAPLRSITPPPLHATLVTLTDQPLLLARPPSIREALSKTFKYVSFCELRALLSSPIDYAMPLKDLLNGRPLTTQLTGIDDLLICVL